MTERLLLVEDDRQGASRTRAALPGWPGPLELAHVATLADACGFLRTERVDCVVADLGLPDGHGLEVVADLAGAAPDSALVVLAGPADEEAAIAARAGGAQEFLLRDEVTTDALVGAVRAAVHRNRALRRRAQHDRVTGLPGRGPLAERLAKALRRAGSAPVAVLDLLLDPEPPLDDALAREVARRLEIAVRPGDTVARVAAREFVLVCEDVRDGAAAARLADRVVAGLPAPYASACALGLALSDPSTRGADALLAEARRAVRRPGGAAGDVAA
jgi:PleD family two-component response regulator